MAETSRPPKSVLQRIRSLRDRKGRRDHGTFLVEGSKLVREALDGGLRLRSLLVSESYHWPENQPSLSGLGSDRETYSLSDSEFDRITPTDSPQGILAEFEIPEPIPLTAISRTAGPLLILDEVQDPGNVGTAIRSCAALGGGGVLLTQGCADIWNPKTVRAAAGALFRLPVAADLDRKDLFDWLAASRLSIWIAAARGESLHGIAGPEGGIAVILGNEAKGADEIWKKIPRAIEVGLPMSGGVDSLNVGVTSAVFLALLREKSFQKPDR